VGGTSKAKGFGAGTALGACLAAAATAVRMLEVQLLLALTFTVGLDGVRDQGEV
jgi:hypothetical protein